MKIDLDYNINNMETSVNNKCKAFTSLEQSKKLAEILPLKSADHFHIIGHLHTDGPRYEVIRSKNEVSDHDSYWPCWPLAALIDILPPYIKDDVGIEYSLSMNKVYIEYSNPNISGLYSTYIHTCGNNNLVDACVEMILKLHELKMLSL